MSRKIKFRAWWRDDKYMPNGKMYMVAGFHNIVEHDYDEPERDISDTPQKVFIVNELPSVEKVNWNNAKDMVLMQYTGLKDKNGVEIYEGDIIRMPADLWIGDESVGKAKGTFRDDAFVEYVNGSFRLNKLGDESKNFYGVLNYSKNNYSEVLEVIGNIYQNPELLTTIG